MLHVTYFKSFYLGRDIICMTVPQISLRKCLNKPKPKVKVEKIFKDLLFMKKIHQTSFLSELPR